ncbi:putative cathepsin B6 cysteine protease [Monocercomonoides exilis]|uniref:putative cathepsin B6 cysteine protease n=1 Tax=Monocercomonoides exilis TaxID=2049356 RepID=UPI00355A40EA|nr:putative cathepsin B6 cysteine protease [Monocercomonoides exilis]|eukprot:MONOS_5630.1-p1 / transcript=MONOS_5630.1 / gene=MONOS_5630 / organism=Monocercomonoides_exilis_PA203 / gene_product=cathepsin B6 cysteine protease / transcript_product=cathepsin B6 cysteine protease / location=Mono_scaffold00166:39511-40380(-) / protein_length=289 / sequence_SO=supercontig / SO=protein_coding / is_pseudo=false
MFSIFPIVTFSLLLSPLSGLYVEIINNDPTSTWVAVEYPPSIMSIEKAKRRLGSIVDDDEPFEPYVEPNDVPDEFDGREEWKGMLPPVIDQGDCNSCYALATAESTGTRFAIKGCNHGTLSAQDLVSCDKTDNGCSGGSPSRAMIWVRDHGITTEQCLPYVSGTGRVPSCPSRCMNGSTVTRYQGTRAIGIPASIIQKHLIENGPVYAHMVVYGDFTEYRSGVYQHKEGASFGGHAVLLVGWGIEEGTPYWLCQNTWGPNFGENGFFKIIRGKNECDFEKKFYAVTVDC